jgi:methionyl-tRNA formyltransferase
MRIAFAGTPGFAAAALRALHAAGHDIALVLTQPDRPAGRGLKLQPSAVKLAAQALGLPVAQPRSLRLDGRFPDDAAAAQAALAHAGVALVVVAAYGLILPAWTLALPPRGCLNIHGSLLPRWRGAAPIQRAIEAGDTHTGITLMQMDQGLDTGAMLLKAAVPIGPDDTAATLHDTLAGLGARLVVDGLARLDSLAPEAQPSDGVTYAHKIDKAEAPLDWALPAAVLERRIRAFDPFPGATAVLGRETVKVWRASLDPQGPGPVLPCGDGLPLRLTQLQRAGGKRVDGATWQRQVELAGGSRI